MSTPYTSSYSVRYSIPSVQQQIEVSVVHDVEDINNEDPTSALPKVIADFIAHPPPGA
jgi:hypothetical protein